MVFRVYPKVLVVPFLTVITEGLFSGFCKDLRPFGRAKRRKILNFPHTTLQYYYP